MLVFKLGVNYGLGALIVGFLFWLIFLKLVPSGIDRFRVYMRTKRKYRRQIESIEKEEKNEVKR